MLSVVFARFKYGAPPQGGFVFGIDRLVSIPAGEENIREVIAFPKTQSGADPMTTPRLARRGVSGHRQQAGAPLEFSIRVGATPDEQRSWT